ncbi:MAG: galactosyldiacylglycerol synthase [Candidatus Tectimicrobiota bacterium]
MINLYEVGTSLFLGTITESQLRFLIDQLEEESAEDTEYYINGSTLEMFESAGAEASLLTVLRQALGPRQEMDIEWRRE